MGVWRRIRKYKNMDVTEKSEELSKTSEKSDFLAMWLAALYTLWLPVLIVLLIFAALLLLIFA